jgi:hypothetical protein
LRFAGGYGAAHAGAKHPGYLDRNLGKLSGLPVVERIQDGTGRTTAAILSDGAHGR